MEAGIILDGCRNASIKNNNWDADYTYTKLKTTNMKSTDYKNRTDYRSMLQKEARSDSSRFKYGTEPGFIADSNVVNSYNSVLAQAKQQSGSATQLSAKTLLENLIKARKVLDTATVVPLTTGWYYILAADSAAEATGARRALTAPDAATSPVWQEAIERDWHTVWHITRIDSTASVYDVRGPLFSAQNYATSTPQFFLPLDKAGHFALTNLSDGEMPALFLSRTDDGATVLGRATRGGDTAWRLESIPQDVISNIRQSLRTGKGETVNVYSADGTLLKSSADADKAAEGLPEGIYIIGGKKRLLY